MNQFICQFTPAVLSVVLLGRIQKKPLRGWDFAIPYAIMTGVINMLDMVVLTFIFPHGGVVFKEELFSASFSCRYLLISFFLALLTPYVYDVVRRTVRIELTVRINPGAVAELLGGDDEEVEHEAGQE